MVRAKAVLGPGSSGLQGRISLIKLDKSREEPKSSAAGERKELMLKSKSLLLVCWAVCMRTHGNVALACSAKYGHRPEKIFREEGCSSSRLDL